MMRKTILIVMLLPAFAHVFCQDTAVGKLGISANKRYLTKGNGSPFFWLGDTGWLLFARLNREDAEKYLEDRRQKGFNVIQVMVLHTLRAVNAYGDTALINRNVATPKTTAGNAYSDTVAYDYWDHVDYIIDLAAKKGLFMGLVPVWGANVKAGWVSRQDAKTYAAWLAERYRDKPNIIWLNGGDVKGTDSLATWKLIGETLNAVDPNHLITYHPFGRTTSSTWFHQEGWLDFNMFQSGHRSYEQDTAREEHKFGPDNWKFVRMDYAKKPTKPTLDGEPSYEHIPYGLHDTTQPRWTDSDVRRYGYWSVFAGGCGYTYGHSSVMQMHSPSTDTASYGSRFYWYDAIDHPGAKQMTYLKQLMLSRSYFERVPAQDLIAGKQGERYDYVAATRGRDYAFIYTYSGKNFSVHLGKIRGSSVMASWYSPRDGKRTPVGVIPNTGVRSFDPPGEPAYGNDWVLVLDKG